MQVAEEFDVDGVKAVLYFDPEPPSPREWSNIGAMVCWHSRYNLGDKHAHANPTDFRLSLLPDAVRDRLEARYEREDNRLFTQYYQRDRAKYEAESDQLERNHRARISRELDRVAVVLPLFLYDHSGRTISTAPFSCPWDSGQVGYIYVTFERARQAHGWKVITKARRAKLVEYLQDEVKAYDDYLTGQVYGYVLTDENGDDVDSLWGIYDVEYARTEARNAATQYAKEQ